MVKLGGFLVSSLILPGYKVYLFSRRQILRVYQSTGNVFWDIITHRFIIHGIVIFIGLMIIGNNIQAQVVGFRDENYGKNSILYALVGGDELALIEETSSGSSNTNADVSAGSRLGYQNGMTASTPPAETGNTEEQSNTLPTIEGGLALLKPNISPMAEGTVSSHYNEEIYIVQAGDTVASITEKFGVSIYTILWENNLTERSYIRPGDKLVVLPATGVKHKVKRGETLEAIAKKYNVDQEQVIAYNDLIDEGGLQVGQELFIPGGRKLVTPPPAPSPIYREVRSYVGAPSPAVSPSAAKLQWPASGHGINQYYSWRHTGLDIDGNVGSAIYAAEAGTVIRAQASGWNGGYGKNIIIEHANGMQTLYGHLSQLFVSVGDTVSRGQNIALMGNTGRSTGPHLHFEVRVTGSRLNPLGYIR